MRTLWGDPQIFAPILFGCTGLYSDLLPRAVLLDRAVSRDHDSDILDDRAQRCGRLASLEEACHAADEVAVDRTEINPELVDALGPVHRCAELVRRFSIEAEPCVAAVGVLHIEEMTIVRRDGADTLHAATPDRVDHLDGVHPVVEQDRCAVVELAGPERVDRDEIPDAVITREGTRRVDLAFVEMPGRPEEGAPKRSSKASQRTDKRKTRGARRKKR